MKTSEEIERLYDELEEVKQMTENEVCEKFNVDSRTEYIAILEEEITALENFQCEYDDDYDVWDDHGFASEADYVRWRFGA